MTNPLFSLEAVDEAVRAVLSEMFSRSRTNPLASTTKMTGVEVFSGPLFSLRQAEILSPLIVELQIAPGTVVTPLARDHLKRLGVAIRFVAKSDVARLKNAGEWGFFIDTERNRGTLEAFRRGLLESNEVWSELGPTLENAADWIVEFDGRGALMLTDEASIAVYRACQLPGVRASSAHEPEAAARAAKALGVNLLVVEPAGKSIAFLNQIGRSFRRAGGPVAPDWLSIGRRSS